MRPSYSSVTGPASAALRVLPQRLVDRSPLAALLAAAQGVLADVDRAQLSLQLEVALEAGAVEPSLRDGGTDRAAGLALVGAVAEAAGTGASDSTSSNAASRPAPSDHSWISRSPGVSTRRAPPGSATSSRCVVVWRPRWSASRTSCVFCFSRPRRRLTIVLLPTPDEPRRATVRAAREPRRERRRGPRRAWPRARPPGHPGRCRRPRRGASRARRRRGRPCSARRPARPRSPTRGRASARGGAG